MKFGPLTFQCACLVCVCRSMQSASRALSNSTTLTRVASGMSFFVLNMLRLLVRALANGLITPVTVMRSRSRLASEEGQQVGVDLILMRRREAVRRPRIVDLLRALDEPGRFLR